MKILSKLKGHEFLAFLLIVFFDVASLNIYKEFTGTTQLYVYFLMESVRTFTLYYFIHWLVSLGGVKDRATHRALSCATKAMVFYALMYVIKQACAVVGQSWLDWAIFSLTVAYCLVLYYGFNNIRRYLRGSVH